MRCSGKFERRLLVNRGWMAGARNLDAVIGEEALGELAQLVLAKVAAFYQVLAWVAHALDLLELDPQNVGDDRVASLVGDQEERLHRLALAVAVYPADALLMHARRLVEFAEHHRAAGVLQAIDACAGA